jgi:hypothetical protein
MKSTNVSGRPFKRFLNRAELPPCWLHDLCQTCATMLLVRWDSFRSTSSSFQAMPTCDRYNHVIEGMGNGPADVMDGDMQA